MLGYEFNAKGAFLPKFLGFIFVLFCGILVVAWYIAKQADPVILDEHGAYRAGGHGKAQ